MEDYQSTAARLFTELGLPEAEANEDGVLQVYVDGDLPIYVRPDATGDCLILHGGLGSIGAAEDPGAIAQRLLQGSVLGVQSGGYSVGIVPDTDLVILMARAPLATLEAERLVATFEAFVDTAIGWREALRAQVIGGAQESAEPVAERSTPGGFA